MHDPPVPLRLPQARDLDKVRKLLSLLASGIDDPELLGTEMGAGKAHARRHAMYYREAAEVLGLVAAGCWTIAPRGAALLETSSNDAAERELLLQAVRDSICLGRIGDALLDEEEPDRDELVRYASDKLPDRSLATIERRVRDTLSWRARLHGTTPDSPSTVAQPVAVHSTSSGAAATARRTRATREAGPRGASHNDPPQVPAASRPSHTIDEVRAPATETRRSAPLPTGDTAGGNRRDPHRLVAGLARDAVTLELHTVDVCFLAALHLRTQQGSVVELDEDLLVDVFEQICDLVDIGAENPRKRATHAIARLRTQRLLARVDGAGIVAAGAYTLTSLANAIVQFFLADERLTRESLTLLTGAVINSLGQLRTAARQAESSEQWRTDVVAPLGITVGDLVAGIERRQRGLDAQQEEVQQQIGALLETQWFEAVAQCQEILESTTRTLRELGEILLRDSHQIQTLLQELLAMAIAADVIEAQEAITRVIDNVDRMAAWGLARQAAWSKYYRFVHRFLRDVVRLDPARALSKRLVEQVRAWPTAPFFLVAAAEGKIAVLRPIEARLDRPAVEQARRDRSREPVATAPDDEELDLERLVLAALHGGPRHLGEVTEDVLAQLPEHARYAAAGIVAALVAQHADPRPARPRPWVAVDKTLQIEDWPLRERR